MATPIKLRLPLLPSGHLYQLVDLGQINRKRNSTHQYELFLHFIEKSGEDGFQKPIGVLRSCKISMADSYEFIRGSLWDSNGNRVSAGTHVTDESIDKTHRIFPARYSFLLGGRQSIAQRLGTILSPALVTANAPLARLFLAAASENWVIPRQVGGTTILLPCFELLRVLYYEAGLGLLAHYFSRRALSDICIALAAPVAANHYTGHIRVRRKAFTEAQQCIMAELCFNIDYLHTITAVHSNLALALLRNPEGAYPQADFYMHRPVRFQANGFHFQAGHKRYFFVCGLWPLSNPFSFQDLIVDLPAGQQQTVRRKRPGQTTDEPGPGALLFQASTRANPLLDSQEPGSSRYREATVELHARQGIPWPQVK
jgi:hypothetical protein